uniref:Mediator of RNA polymerase II transcription subunit 15 n=1 Tax=Monopterus albus TaxID=43700 RepID=A0A3Q3K3R0_MONAL
MDVPGADSDWRSPQFRQKIVAQIDETMRKAGTAHTKSSNDMESHVYAKAKTREEYLSMVARLIIHFRDIHKKALGGPDPMNALTNLTGVGGGPGAIGMGPRPTGAPVGGMGAMGPMQIGPHAMAGGGGRHPCVSSMWCVFAVNAHLQSIQWILAASKRRILVSGMVLFSASALARCVCLGFQSSPQIIDWVSPSPSSHSLCSGGPRPDAHAADCAGAAATATAVHPVPAVPAGPAAGAAARAATANAMAQQQQQNAAIQQQFQVQLRVQQLQQQHHQNQHQNQQQQAQNQQQQNQVHKNYNTSYCQKMYTMTGLQTSSTSCTGAPYWKTLGAPAHNSGAPIKFTCNTTHSYVFHV